MPIYEYFCHDCHSNFEELLRMSDLDKVILCPICNSKRTEKKISSFSTKGSKFKLDACNNDLG